MKKIIFILVVILLAGGAYFGYKLIVRPKTEPAAGQPTGSDMLGVQPDIQAERAQMFKAAREYIKPDSVEGMEVDLKIIKQLDRWVLLEIIPLNVETDNAAMILEKVDGEWQPRDWGTILPGWQERVPELFE